MKDGIEYVVSIHFKTKHAIRGHLVHEDRDKKFKSRWFIYMIYDSTCTKQYIGSTSDINNRWSNHKSDCNHKNNSCGLSAHFMLGCNGDTEREKLHLNVTLLDYFDVTLEQTVYEKHGGIGCLCKLCDKLKDIENTWIMKIGSYYYPAGLNSREELRRKVRVNY